MRRNVRRSVIAINGAMDEADGSVTLIMEESQQPATHYQNGTNGLHAPLLDHSKSDAQQAGDEECQVEEVPPVLHGHSTTWQQVTTALLSLQLGWGLWLYPSDYARLGWCAHGILALLAMLTAYSATLFSRLYEAVPGTVLFSDVGKKAAGMRGALLVSVVVYLLDGTRCVILHLAATQSLRHMFPSDHLPALWKCGAAVLVYTAALVQVRSMANMSWVFMTGTGSQLIAVGVVIWELINNSNPNAQRSWVEVKPGDYAPAAVAVMNMIFAFGGQFAFTEIICGMAKPKHFVRAATVCTFIMSILYAGLGTIGYWSRGNAIQGIVIFSLPDSPRARFAAGCILIQATAQYLINVNVWTHNLLVLLARWCRSSGHEKVKCSTDHCGWRWLGVSVFVVLYSYLICISLPFFSTLVGLMTSVTYLMCAYTLPAWFALKLLGRRLCAAERVLLVAIIPISILVSLAGLWGSVVELVSDIGSGGEGWKR